MISIISYYLDFGKNLKTSWCILEKNTKNFFDIKSEHNGGYNIKWNWEYKDKKNYLINILIVKELNFEKILNLFAIVILTSIKFICYTDCTIHT